MRYRVFAFALVASFALVTPSVALAAQYDGDQIAADVLLPKAEKVRQIAVVWFHKPVQIGETVLLGKYIIEHDNDRMAKGLPCTHIYAADKPTVPVVKFHCVHLEGDATTRDLVTLRPTGDPMIPSKFASFQFAGETAAHGFPKAR